MSTKLEYHEPTLTELEFGHTLYGVRDLDRALLESIQKHNPDAIAGYPESYLLRMLYNVRSSVETKIGSSRPNRKRGRGLRTIGQVLDYFSYLAERMRVKEELGYTDITTFPKVGLKKAETASDALENLIGPYAPALIQLHQQAMEKINKTE